MYSTYFSLKPKTFGLSVVYEFAEQKYLYNAIENWKITRKYYAKIIVSVLRLRKNLHNYYFF